MGKLLKARKDSVSWANDLPFMPRPNEPISDFMSPEDCIDAGIGLTHHALYQDDEQPIIEVTQLEVKKALKELLIRQNELIGVLYKAHETYNDRYFQGKLSVPLFTIEKMSHKTLAEYLAGADAAGLDNHMVFNKNFIALNTETRILETLKHVMIHQYQDEVLYEKYDKDGKLLHEGEKRPKDWHNKDFKDWANNVGIKVKGRKGYGSPAKMPEPKSYNRKFSCKCTATNGYPLTIWSTREIKAVCQVCNSPFSEVKKAGEVIPVGASDIERDGQDAIENRMTKEFAHFEKFKEKYALSDKLKELKHKGIAYKEGTYQKGHNAYLRGYHYWLAYGELIQKSKQKANTPKVSSRLKRGAAKNV